MQNSPNLETAIKKITSLIKKRAKPVLTVREFKSILREFTSKGIKAKVLESILEENGVIHQQVLRCDEYRDIMRISVPSLNPTFYHYAISLRGGTYLSHSSAVHLLGLTQQQPKIIYVNKEQSKKPQPEGSLTQESIDRAFSRAQRRSKYVFRINGHQLVLLSGKATGRAGVEHDDIIGLPRTCLERTLIDITVRPRYAGGVFQVAQAFKEAVNDINESKLLSILNTLDYRYPYHQALGFYLERAGASNSVLNRLRKMGLEFNFYLDYAMADPNWDKSWRVFYPLGV